MKRSGPAVEEEPGDHPRMDWRGEMTMQLLPAARHLWEVSPNATYGEEGETKWVFCSQTCRIERSIFIFHPSILLLTVLCLYRALRIVSRAKPDQPVNDFLKSLCCMYRQGS